jgi:hypothetical protein
MALDVATAKAEARELQQEVKGRIERYPLVFLGVALGAGYVAGGGLGSAVTSQVARMSGSLAWRFLVLPALTATVTRALGIGDTADGVDEDEELGED